MKRRAFLVALPAFLLFPFKVFSLPRPGMTNEAILRGLLEALIPSDDTPGAKEAKLYEKIARSISENKRKKKNYKHGIALVRKALRQSRGKSVDWNAVLTMISRSRFFYEFRTDAFTLFYSDPVGWQVAGYVGPPLVGYPDYYKCE